jgi:hypothetical protein
MNGKIDSVCPRCTTPKTAPHDSGSCIKAPINQGPEDPHGLRTSAPLIFAAHAVATDLFQKLLSRTLGEEAVVHRLCKLVPKSAFEIDYVARQAFKFINPHGHGANSARFSNETLGWFRQTYPADAHLTAGLSLMLCAAKWWTHEQGHRSVIPRMSPLTTADLDRKLKSFGFLSGERQAICRMLRRVPSHQ